jgi:ligand-binding sensor domain-containing protein/signal transduction histidine kinase
MVPQRSQPPSGGGSTFRLALLAALTLTALLAPARAQALDPARRVTQYQHHAWGAEDGLPQNTVLSLAQAQDGALWVSTAEGLLRFDGARFQLFDKRNTPALHSHAAHALLQDSQGVLWVGTNQGLVAYEGGVFRRVASEGPLARAVVTALAVDASGLYVATSEGLGRLRGEHFELLGGAGATPLTGVTTLLHDAAGTLWAGGSAGLHRAGPDGRLVPVRLEPGEATTAAPSAGPPLVTSLREGRDGSLWVGSWAGLYRLRGGQQDLFTPEDGLPSLRVTALFEDRDANLWVGTRLGGLTRYADGRFQTLRLAATGPSDDTVNVLLEDQEGNLWVGADTFGLHRLRNGEVVVWGVPEGLANDVVSPVLEDSRGVLWVGGRGGLDRIDRRRGSVQHFGREHGLTAESVRSLAEGRDGVLWVGTQRNGAFQIDGDYVVHHSRATGLPSDTVWAVTADSKGDVWFATSAGLAQLSRGTFRTFGVKEGVPTGALPAMLEDASGALWVGSMEQGLLRYQHGRFTRFTEKDGLASNQVVELHDDGEGSLWIGSASGLTRYRYADGRFTRFTTAQGLFDDSAFRILQDDRGYFWISCNKGIYRVSRQELAEVAEGKRAQVGYLLLDQTDGMRSAECNGTSQPSGTRTRDGRLWFPTIGGLVSLDPARLRRSPLPEPQVYEVRINGLRLGAPHEPIEVEPGPRDLEVQFGAVSLSGADRIAYQYRLAGLEEGWRDADVQRTARYVHLPPGRYRFELRASAEGGPWSEPGPVGTALLPVHFRPHVWETAWFWSALALALLVAGGWALRLRVRRMRARESWLEARVEERTRELAQANGVLDEHLRALRETQAQLVQAGRMAAVGTLAAGVGHEVNNPLAYILSNLDFACSEVVRVQRALSSGRDLPAQEAALAGERLGELEQCLREALHGAERVRRIVRDLKTFSRAEDDEQGSVDLHAVLDAAAKLASTELRHRARLVKAYGEVPRVEGNEARLGQVFLNLLINAAQALPEGHVGEHEVRLLTRFEPDAAGSGGGRVVAEVQDTGSGIAPAVLQRIFDPFFTTKPVGVGTGLGLSLCHAFVTAMGGRISVESAPGRGSTFRVSLPASRTHAPAASAAPFEGTGSAAVGPEAPRGRILVVDDEPLVLGAVRRALGPQHDIEGVSSARRALELLAGAEDRFDVVLCDLMMPEMTGMELYAEVRASHPGRARRFVFISGGAFTPGAREFLASTDCPLLEKPFDLPRLRELVQARVALARGEVARAA